ncbi:MAG TPA: alpha/beta hydrolase [Kamptonema sp.]|nr:alpha/beta hydrolase [Kamptonema sp.]
MSLKSISVPAKNEPAVGAIVALHGWGANGADLTSLVPVLNLPDYQFEFPEAPFPHPYVVGGKMWYDLETKEYLGLAESRQMLSDWLVSLETKRGMPLSKTILGGFSQGGAMTLDVGLSLPLAGLICLSGYLHAVPQPSSNVLPPTLIVHGRQDQVVPVSAAVRSRDALTALGASVQYQEINMGHEILPEVVDLMRSFVVETMPKVS